MKDEGLYMTHKNVTSFWCRKWSDIADDPYHVGIKNKFCCWVVDAVKE